MDKMFGNRRKTKADSESGVVRSVGGIVQRDASVATVEKQLVSDEVAFLSREVREVLLQTTLPKVPSQSEDVGAVLFVDISGFTNLGNKLRKDFTAAAATEYLSKEIFTALKELTDICLRWGGDVVKFAGDALLCVWKLQDKAKIESKEVPELYYEIPNMEHALKLARRAGFEMMKAIKRINESLELHGGIGSGKLLQFHLGNDSTGIDSHRWHLVTGEACVEAGELLEDSPKGSLYYTTDEKDDKGNLVPHSITRETDITGSKLFFQDSEVLEQQLPIQQWMEHLRKEQVAKYVPLALREDLQSGVIAGGEIYPRVSIMFVGLDNLQLTAKELQANQVEPAKLKRLNKAYNSMAGIVRAFGGEVRDLLFDDKGCVFIAVFGAHVVVELSELKCVRAALRLMNLIRQCKIGIDVGQCFTGMCGSPQRHDFVIMGHEVNMSSRFMGGAKVGQILAGPGIQKKTNAFINFTPYVLEYFKRKPFQLEDGTWETRKVKTDDFECFITEKPINRNPSFIANFRSKGSFSSVNMNETTFVGRQQEVAQITSFISLVNKSKKSATILVSGEEGIGKSALIREVRNAVQLQSDVVFSAAFSIEQNTSYFMMRQLICSLLEVSQDIGHDAIIGKLKQLDVRVEETAFNAIFPSAQVEGLAASSRRSIRRFEKSPESFQMLKVLHFKEGKSKEERRAINFLVELVLMYQEKVIKDDAQGLVLVVEDIQWCDPDSLRLLHGLIAAEIPRLAVIVSYRETTLIADLKRRKTLSNFIEEIDKSRVRNIARIELSRFTRKESEELVVNLFQDHTPEGNILDEKQFKLLGLNSRDFVDQRIKDLVWDKTQGQPSHVTLLVKWFIESKNVVHKPKKQQYTFTNEAAEQQCLKSMPDTLKETIVYRLDFLPGDERNILKVAATIGDLFPEDLLFDVLKLDGVKITPKELKIILRRLETKHYLTHLGLKVDIMSTRGKSTLDPRLNEHMRKSRDEMWQFSADITQQAIRSLIPNVRYEQLWLHIEQVIQKPTKRKKGGVGNTLRKLRGTNM